MLRYPTRLPLPAANVYDILHEVNRKGHVVLHHSLIETAEDQQRVRAQHHHIFYAVALCVPRYGFPSCSIYIWKGNVNAQCVAVRVVITVAG